LDPTPNRYRCEIQDSSCALDREEDVLSISDHLRIVDHGCLPRNIRLLICNTLGRVELSDVPLEVRCAAAVEVIWCDAGLGRRDRRELLATAIWPRDLRPRQPIEPPAPAVTVEDMRAQAREAFRAGASIQSIADQFDVPWMTARAWVRARSVGRTPTLPL